MIILRKGLLDGMRRGFDEDYIDRIYPSLEEDNPELIAQMGEQEVRRTARSGMDRAEGYGIATEANVFYFIELMIVLGTEFDEDESLGWPGEILNDDSIESEDERMDLLCRSAQRHLDRTREF